MILWAFYSPWPRWAPAPEEALEGRRLLPNMLGNMAISRACGGSTEVKLAVYHLRVGSASGGEWWGSRALCLRPELELAGRSRPREAGPFPADSVRVHVCACVCMREC